MSRRRPDPSVYCWFLHEQMLTSLINAGSPPSLSASWLQRRMYGDALALADLFERWLRSHHVSPLEQMILEQNISSGHVCWVELDFEWSDVAHESQLRRAGADNQRSTFSAELTLASKAWTIFGNFDPARLTCTTALTELRGIRRQYLLGQIANIGEDEIEIRPIAIATRLLPPAPAQWNTEWQHISPDRIEQFAPVDWTMHVSREQLTQLRAVPEQEIKRALAAILDEPTIPNDWGGEQFDLWTSHLRVDGANLTAAFLLKGPARFTPMTISHLGKNGDQLVRLAASPAEVLVLQHCHEIRTEVRSMLKAHASDFRNVRRYMIIDGYDTYRILKTFQRLPGDS